MADKIDTGGPAYPVPEVRSLDGSMGICARHDGMTLRQAYAMAAMKVLLVAPRGRSLEAIVRDSFIYADAMIAHEKAGR